VGFTNSTEIGKTNRQADTLYYEALQRISMSDPINDDDYQETDELCPQCGKDNLVVSQRGRSPDDLINYYLCRNCGYTDYD